MKQTVSRSQFHDEFNSCRPENFSYDGLDALFDYLEQYEEDIGEEMELDVIAICCEFSEYGSLTEAYSQYTYSAGDGLTEDNFREWLLHRTMVIEFDGGVIIQDF